jgi:hypothetical protein
VRSNNSVKGNLAGGVEKKKKKKKKNFSSGEGGPKTNAALLGSAKSKLDLGYQLFKGSV